MDTDLIKSLKCLRVNLDDSNEQGLLDTIESIGLEKLFELETFVLALCLEGEELVAFMASLGMDNTLYAERFEKILNICESEHRIVSEQARRRHTPTSLCLQIIKAWDPTADPQLVLSTIERSLAHSSVSNDEILKFSVSEMHSKKWESALEGFLLLRERLRESTPIVVNAKASTCLHRLGRYQEAERVAQEGLGTQREIIAIKSDIPPESVLIRGWGDFQTPFISIICTTFNHERYIEKAIQGFLSQRTDYSFEIIIHDDASTDRTQSIVRSWQEKYPSIVSSVLQVENQLSRGVRPFELMLKRARGKYIATCEGDDYWISPSKLQRQVEFLENHPDFSCSAHNYYIYNEAQLAISVCFNAIDRVLSERELMNITRLLWLPTLVFRKTFSTMPSERAFSPIGDQFLTSYLGTFGKCMYFESFVGTVRRVNQYSLWTPADERVKEYSRVKAWISLIRMHENAGNLPAVSDLMQRVNASSLPQGQKQALLVQSMEYSKASFLSEGA